MTHKDNSLWSLNVNYHRVRPHDALNIINKDSKCHCEINSTFCICPYETTTKVGEYCFELQSLNLIHPENGIPKSEVHKDLHVQQITCDIVQQNIFSND